MALQRKKREPSKDEKTLQDLRKIIREGAQEHLDRIRGRFSGLGAAYQPLSGPSAEELLVVSLRAQEIFNRSSEKFAKSSIRLAKVLAWLTILLVIVAAVDIALRIFN
jgi:hypothetical protein